MAQPQNNDKVTFSAMLILKKAFGVFSEYSQKIKELKQKFTMDNRLSHLEIHLYL